MLLLLACATPTTDTGKPGTTDSGPGDSDSATLPPTGDSLGDPVPVALVEADLVDVDEAIDAPGDADFYAVDLEAGDDLFLAVGAEVDGAPDVVLQVYDPDGVLVSSSDDLPYRIHGTDSGLWLRADRAGRWILEVQDYMDWAGAVSEADDWEYTLSLGLNGGYLDATEASGNDSMAEASATEPAWYTDPWSSVLDADLAVGFLVGDLEEGDEDWFPISLEGLGVCEVSTFPGTWTAATPHLELYAEDGTLLASTDDPEIHPVGAPLGYDVGLRYVVADGSDVWVRVTDTASGGGSDHWYGLLAYSWSANEGWVVPHEPTGAGTELELAQAVETQSISLGQGVWVFGSFDGEPFHAWSVAGSAGSYLTFWVETASAGSALDASVAVLDSAGNVLATAEDRGDGDHTDDPAVIDLRTEVDGPYTLVVYDDNAAVGPSASYNAAIYLSEEPTGL